MINTPSRNSSVGAIYHQILIKPKWLTATDITDKVKKLKIDCDLRSVSSKLKQLYNRDLVERRKDKNNKYEYMRKDIYEGLQQISTVANPSPVAIPPINDDLFPEENPIKKRISHGEGKKLMIEFLQKNIGQDLAGKQIADGAGIPYNSSISVKLNKLEADNYIETKRNPFGGRGLLYTPLESIKNYGKIPANINSNELTFPKESLNLSQPIIENNKSDLVNTFQRIIDQQNTVKQYENAFHQIAAILASIDIIEGV